MYIYNDSQREKIFLKILRPDAFFSYYFYIVQSIKRNKSKLKLSTLDNKY